MREDQDWVAYDPIFPRQDRYVRDFGPVSPDEWGDDNPSSDDVDEGKKWIQGAHLKRGALHRDLGIAQDRRIPRTKLQSAAKRTDKVGKRARLALTLSRLGKRESLTEEFDDEPEFYVDSRVTGPGSPPTSDNSFSALVGSCAPLAPVPTLGAGDLEKARMARRGGTPVPIAIPWSVMEGARDFASLVSYYLDRARR